MVRVIKASYLSGEEFVPFGRVLELPVRRPDVATEAIEWWDKVGILEVDRPELGFLVVKRRGFSFSKMERHRSITEAFFPLEGVSIFPMAPASEDGPDLDEIRAFVIDGSKGVVLGKGVWHWAPFPLTEKATFLVLISMDTVERDVEFVDLGERISISL